MITQLKNPAQAAPLFAGQTDSLIASGLSGSMGRVYMHAQHGGAAQLVVGDFCFFGGAPDEALLAHVPADFASDELILTPPDSAWQRLLEQVWGARAARGERYALTLPPDGFDPERLRRLANQLPQGVQLRAMDGSLYRQALEHGWSRDFVGLFASGEDFARRGLGVAALRDGALLAGASSYAVYPGGIEIEVDTRADCRRQGLATACSARLILACLERGLTPHWDAQNRISVALAEKLGYRYSHAYPVYFVPGHGKRDRAPSGGRS